MRRSLACSFFVIACASLVGCGGGVRWSEVSGKVQFDGAPIDGTIAFYPAEGPSAGAEVKNGLYSTKVPVGEVTVKINAAKATGKSRPAYAGDPEKRVIEQTVEILPAKYNEATTLSRQVTAGKTVLDFDLTK